MKRRMVKGGAVVVLAVAVLSWSVHAESDEPRLPDQSYSRLAHGPGSDRLTTPADPAQRPQGPTQEPIVPDSAATSAIVGVGEPVTKEGPLEGEIVLEGNQRLPPQDRPPPGGKPAPEESPAAATDVDPAGKNP